MATIKASTSSLKQRAVKGIFWVAIANILGKGISLGSYLFLARLLPKSEFGVYSVITTLSMILFIVASFGFDIWYTQKQDGENESFALFAKVNTTFTVLISFLLFIFSYQISVFYQEPELYNLIRYTSAYFLLAGSVQILRQYLAKRLEFRKTSSAIVIGQIFQAAASIIAAFYIKSVYALFIGYVLSTTVEFAILAYTIRKPLLKAIIKFPRVSVWNGLKTHWKFTSSVMLNKLLNTAARLMPPLILARTLGFAATGLFSTMENLIAQPVQLIIGAISTTSLPVLSKIDSKNLSYTSLRLSRILLLVAAPLFIYLWIFPEDIILLILGPNWIEGANILRYLMVGVFLNIVVSPISSNFSIRNKPHWLLVWNTIFIIGNLIILFYGSRFGIETTVMLYAIFNTLMRLGLQVMMSYLLEVSRSYFLRIYIDYLNIWIPLVAIGLAVRYLHLNIWWVFIYMIFGLVFYVILIHKFHPKIYVELSEIFAIIFKRKKAKT